MSQLFKNLNIQELTIQTTKHLLVLVARYSAATKRREVMVAVPVAEECKHLQIKNKKPGHLTRTIRFVVQPSFVCLNLDIYMAHNKSPTYSKSNGITQPFRILYVAFSNIAMTFACSTKPLSGQ